MPEMLSPTGDRWAPGSESDVALDHRRPLLRRLAGFIVGHVTPEAQVGGPIALVKNGDRITIDAKRNTITLEVDPQELARRRARFRPPPLRATRGTLAKYIRCVRPASEGCVTDE